ncbi:hypothetical protein, partial [Desulfovibrio desulfuricans]|uniref:hypothetical protein n=1 Tax=Desulfovibrio desulfuricans TaxID=876 RepID=UPI001C43280A
PLSFSLSTTFFQSTKILFGGVVSSCMQFFKNERDLCSLFATLSTSFCRFGEFSSPRSGSIRSRVAKREDSETNQNSQALFAFFSTILKKWLQMPP